MTATHFMRSKDAENMMLELSETQILLIRTFFRAKRVNLKKSKHTISELRRVIDYISEIRDEELEYYIQVMDNINRNSGTEIDFNSCINKECILGLKLNPRIANIIDIDFRSPSYWRSRQHTPGRQ